ncbi:MAG: hypothetical protein JSR45_06605 [Proteobacteria bacterium]|nr:hypothetical protein [Pseudomonadota bacterium]
MKQWLAAAVALVLIPASASAHRPKHSAVHMPTARELRDFNDVTPKAAKSPPGIYMCWGDNAVIIDKAHRTFGEERCYVEHAPVAAKLAARRLTLLANPAEQGCLGADWVTCAATLSLTNQLTTGILDNELKEPKALHDLDGKPILQTVWIDVFPTYYPGQSSVTQKAHHVELRLDEKNYVTAIYVRLTTYPSQARTKEDWDATGTYELMRGMTSEKCVGDRLDFYRLFRDLMSRRELSDFSNETAYGTTGKAQTGFCGAKLVVHSGGSFDVNSGSHYSEGWTLSSN